MLFGRASCNSCLSQGTCTYHVYFPLATSFVHTCIGTRFPGRCFGNAAAVIPTFVATCLCIDGLMEEFIWHVQTDKRGKLKANDKRTVDEARAKGNVPGEF
eukprot:4030054-Amphidinium_carterae.1